MIRREIFVENSCRVDVLLRKKLPPLLNREISNSKIRRLIVAGKVFVGNNQIRIPGFEVKAGTVVTVEIDEKKLFFEKQADDINFEVSSSDVLFEDEHILIVNKPSHFPTESTFVESRDNLHRAVVRYLFEKQKIENPSLKNPPYAGIVHRLDRDTSGAVLFAKSRAVNASCHEIFESRLVKKQYLVLVSPQTQNARSFLEKGSFSVSFFMGRISPKSQKAKWGCVPKEKGGVYSKTDFTVLRRLSEKKIAVLCDLETGRTHQIRVHLSSLGLPLIGDTLYGGCHAERIMLHSQKLSFPHPVTKEMILAEAPVPKEFF